MWLKKFHREDAFKREGAGEGEPTTSASRGGRRKKGMRERRIKEGGRNEGRCDFRTWGKFNNSKVSPKVSWWPWLLRQALTLQHWPCRQGWPSQTALPLPPPHNLCASPANPLQPLSPCKRHLTEATVSTALAKKTEWFSLRTKSKLLALSSPFLY